MFCTVDSETSCETYLLQAQDEGFGALDLVDLSRLAHRLLDDVSVVVIILQNRDHSNLVRKAITVGKNNEPLPRT